MGILRDRDEGNEREPALPVLFNRDRNAVHWSDQNLGEEVCEDHRDGLALAYKVMVAGKRLDAVTHRAGTVDDRFPVGGRVPGSVNHQIWTVYVIERGDRVQFVVDAGSGSKRCTGVDTGTVGRRQDGDCTPERVPEYPDPVVPLSHPPDRRAGVGSLPVALIPLAVIKPQTGDPGVQKAIRDGDQTRVAPVAAELGMGRTSDDNRRGFVAHLIGGIGIRRVRETRFKVPGAVDDEVHSLFVLRTETRMSVSFAPGE